MSDLARPLPPSEKEVEDQVDRAIDASRLPTAILPAQLLAYDEFGTRPTLADPPAIEIATEKAAPVDPIIRLEQKIDSLAENVASLKRTLRSIDDVLSKLIHR